MKKTAYDDRPVRLRDEALEVRPVAEPVLDEPRRCVGVGTGQLLERGERLYERDDRRGVLAPGIADDDPGAHRRNAGSTCSAKRRAGSRVSRPKSSITKCVQPSARCRSMRSITCAGVPQMPCSSSPPPMWPP